MIGLGVRYALREPLRFALTAGGLACAVILTVFLVGVYRGAVHGSLDYIAHVDADLWVGRRGSWNLLRASSLLTGSVHTRILQLEGVVSAEPLLAALVPAQIGEERRTLLVIGLEGDAPAARPRHIVAGSSVPRDSSIIIDRAFARRYGLGLGDKIDLGGQRARISGISEATNLLVTQYAFASRKELLKRVGVRNRATFVLVSTNMDPRIVATRIDSAIGSIAVFDRETFLDNNRQEIQAGFLPVLWAIAVMGLFVGGAVIALMTYTAVLEKRSDFILLDALGADRSTRLFVVLQQALSAALVGSIGGQLVLLGMQYLTPAFVPELAFRYELWMVGAAVTGAIVMAIAGAILPMRAVLRLAPMEAFRQ